MRANPELCRMLDNIPFNTLFARMVASGRLPGEVHAHDGTYLIAHPYGMSLLFGRTDNMEFNGFLKDYMTDRSRQRPEWMQAHPREWVEVIAEMLGPELAPGEFGDMSRPLEMERLNFRFDTGKFPGPPSGGISIVRTAREIYESMEGRVIPRYFWRDHAHFAAEGTGFTVMHDGIPVSTAFSAFTHGNLLELGIETGAGRRGRGHGEAACRALISHCLDKGLEPVWSCRSDNPASVKLAGKLGFTPTVRVPCFRLAAGALS